MAGLPSDIETLLVEFKENAPCDPSALVDVERALEFEFPPEYRQFMQHSNGGEGSVGRESYLILEPVEQLFEVNRAYAVADVLPSLVMFGSDGGGMGFAFDGVSHAKRIVSFDLCSIDDRWFVGANFWVFLKRLDYLTCGIDWDNPDEQD